MELAILDTSVLIDFFSNRSYPRSDRVKEVLTARGGEIVLACSDVTLAEFLGGLTAAEERKLRSFVTGLTYLSTSRDIAERAAQLRRMLRKRGADIPPSDCLIAAIAAHYDASVWTSDRHFARFPHLRVTSFT